MTESLYARMLLRLIIRSVTTLAVSTASVVSCCLFSLQAANTSAAAIPKRIFFMFVYVLMIIYTCSRRVASLTIFVLPSHLFSSASVCYMYRNRANFLGMNSHLLHRCKDNENIRLGCRDGCLIAFLNRVWLSRGCGYMPVLI